MEIGAAGYQVDWREDARSGAATLAVVAPGTMQGATGNASSVHG